MSFEVKVDAWPAPRGLGHTIEMKFYLKPTCTSCRKAKSFLIDKKASFQEVNLNNGLTVDELEALIGERDYKTFLNTRNELYREKGMSKNPPPRKEAIQLMSEHPNLIKRPILVSGKKIVLGWNPEEMQKLL